MTTYRSMTTDLLSSREVAAIFGVTRETVHRWTRDGLLPTAQKLPGRTGAKLFRAEDVYALKARRDLTRQAS